MVDIINIPDGDVHWGDKMRANLANLSEGVDEANLTAAQALAEASGGGGGGVDQTARDAAAAAQATADGKYTKPNNGIPVADLASEVLKRFDVVKSVKSYGATGTGGDDTAAVQAAVDAVAAAGGGAVYFPNGVYGIDGYKGNQASYSTTLRGGIRLAAGVALVGETRRGAILKNIADDWTSVISIRGGSGIEIRNLTIDGDWPNRPAALLSASTTRGEGIIYWNGSSTAADNVIDNIIVQNTGHYGIGVQNVAVTRMRISNSIGLNIGGDFIDIKEFSANAANGTPEYPKHNIIIDNCVADKIGLNATAAQQEADAAAFDLRGEVLATNLHVRNLNTYAEPDTGAQMPAVCGIRINGDLASNDRIGGRKVRVIGGSVHSNKAVNAGSESVDRVIGVRVGSTNASVVGVAVENCYIGFRIIQTGDSNPLGSEVIACQAINCHGAAADGKGFSIEGAGTTYNSTVDVFVRDSDIGVAITNSVGGTGRFSLYNNTKDHTVSEDQMRLNDYSFYSQANLNTTIARPTQNNFKDMTIWNQIQPTMRLRSTFNGTWTSPYDDGVVSFESADTSGAGATVRAEVRARMTGATGGGTGLVFRANAGAGLVDVMTVNGDRVIINPAVLGNYASDSAASTGGVPVGGLYRNGSSLMVRVA